jgi:hypothetical protein
MNSDALIWMLLPAFVAAGSALLSFFIMQARLEVAVAREREIIAQVRAQVRAQEEIMEEKVRKTEEETTRRCFDNFLADFRVEERHYVKESKSLFVNKKAMVLQERLFFRNIPLSNWVEHEMTLEEGGDATSLASLASAFSSKGTFAPAKESSERALKESSPMIPRLIRG